MSSGSAWPELKTLVRVQSAHSRRSRLVGLPLNVLRLRKPRERHEKKPHDLNARHWREFPNGTWTHPKMPVSEVCAVSAVRCSLVKSLCRVLSAMRLRSSSHRKTCPKAVLPSLRLRSCNPPMCRDSVTPCSLLRRHSPKIARRLYLCSPQKKWPRVFVRKKSPAALRHTPALLLSILVARSFKATTALMHSATCGRATCLNSSRPINSTSLTTQSNLALTQRP